MAKTLTTNISAGVGWNHTNALSGNINVVSAANFAFSAATANGTGAAGTADLVYPIQTTIAPEATLTIDVAGGITDAFGTTITMAKIKFLYIHLMTTTGAPTVIVGDATNPVPLFSATTATVTIRNGGFLLLGDSGATGIPVTATTADEIAIENPSETLTAHVQIFIVGSST